MATASQKKTATIIGIIILIVAFSFILRTFNENEDSFQTGSGTDHIEESSFKQTESGEEVIFDPFEETETKPDFDKESAFVVRVIDGDTIVVRLDDGTEERLRYIGIDTPEKGRPHAEEATRYNAGLVKGKTVLLEKDVSDRDRYGRLLRYVYVEGVMVNALLVANGYANAATFPPDVKHSNHFLDLERSARENEIGLWQDSSETKSAQVNADGSITVFTTRTGTKYHNEDCDSLRRSKIQTTLSEAVSRGYEACKLCKPPE